MKVLLTGGSGFIAAHCVDYLLQGGHDVVFTVRSPEKGEKILRNHSGTPKNKLSYVIVEDIAKEGAFDEAVKSDPPFEAVLHTASPFHFNVTDAKKDLLDPAVIGTTGILKAIKAGAPSVKRVVITSSFAAILTVPHKDYYDESCWNPVTMEQALGDPGHAYRASKTFAEKAAWKFVEEEKPNFTIATINPPLVFGPVVHYLNSLDSINTSNQRIRDMIQGKQKEKLTPTGAQLWIDVRDVALAHVRAAEREEAGQQRFFCTAGYFSNSAISDTIKEAFPDLAKNLPEKTESDIPDDVYKIDNSRIQKVLGIKFRPFKQCIIDTVKSLQDVGA